MVGDQGPIVRFVACAYMAPHAGLELLPTCQGRKRKTGSKAIRRVMSGFLSRASHSPEPRGTPNNPGDGSCVGLDLQRTMTAGNRANGMGT